MRINIIGARALNPIGSAKIKKHASARICEGKTCLQIDVGNPFRGKADHLLISHMHIDHMGKVSTVPRSVEILVPDKDFQDRLSKKTKALIKVFRPHRSTKIGQFKVTAFRVNHSFNTRTFGFRISSKNKTIAWLSDYRNLQGATKYFKNLDILFIGASCWKRNITHRDAGRRGHMAIVRCLKALRQNNIRPKRIILMHLGKQMMPIDERIKQLREMFPQFKIDAAYDNMRLTD